MSNQINTAELVSAVDRSLEEAIKKNRREVSEQIQEKVDGLSARFAEFEQTALTGMRGVGYTAPRETLAESFAKSDSFAAFVNREGKEATFTKSLSLKAAVTNQGADSSGQEPYDSAAQRDPRLANDARRPLTLLEAFPTEPVEAATYEFVQLDSGYTNSADEQATEGSTKNETSLPTTLKSVRPATIAHWLPASEQVLSDTPQLQQQIQSLLNYGVLAKAESLIVGGNGVISGLEQEGTAFTGSSGDLLPTAISEAVSALDIAGWRASHVIMHPTDWHSIRTQQATTNEFIAPGWWSPPMPNIWGLPVVTTPSVSQGTPIVLDASQVAILDRMQVTFEAFRQDAQNARENLVTLRSEARLGFAVYAPSAIRLVSTV